MPFRSRLKQALFLSWAINFGLLLWQTRLLRQPSKLLASSSKSPPPNFDELITPPRLLGIVALGATIDGLGWAVFRPALPRRPELARLIYEYVPGFLFVIGARKLADLVGHPKSPWYRSFLPRGGNAARMVGSTLLYGASERLTRT